MNWWQLETGAGPFELSCVSGGTGIVAWRFAAYRGSGASVVRDGTDTIAFTGPVSYTASIPDQLDFGNLRLGTGPQTKNLPATVSGPDNGAILTMDATGFTKGVGSLTDTSNDVADITVKGREMTNTGLRSGDSGWDIILTPKKLGEYHRTISVSLVVP